MGIYNGMFSTSVDAQEDTLSSSLYKEIAITISNYLSLFIEGDVIRDTHRLFSSNIVAKSSVNDIQSKLIFIAPLVFVALATVYVKSVVKHLASASIEASTSASSDLAYVSKAARTLITSSLASSFKNTNSVLARSLVKAELSLFSRLNGILASIPQRLVSDSFFKVDFERFIPEYLDVTSFLNAQFDIRNTGPVLTKFSSLIGPESNFNTTIVLNNPLLYLSDEYYQPVAYEGVNDHSVCYISYNKNFSLYMSARSLMQFAKILILRYSAMLWNIQATVDVNLGGTVWVTLEKITGKATLNLQKWYLLRNVFLTFNIISKFLLDAQKIKALLPDVWNIEAVFDILLMNIKRFMSPAFDAELIIQDIKNTMWKDGKPAIRVTTLYQDLLRNPRGQIVILEDPTI